MWYPGRIPRDAGQEPTHLNPQQERKQIRAPETSLVPETRYLLHRAFSRKPMCKILLVCDDSILAMLYSEELSEEGYTVVITNKLSELCPKIDGERPDLVLVDCFLGSFGESDLCQSFNSGGYAVPVIFCSDYPPAMREAGSMGVIHWVSRSSDLTHLKRALKNILTGEFIPSDVSPNSLHRKPSIPEQVSFQWGK
jgi:CheY-like chemotaxis protein